ncbi:amino acid transporter [Microdochium bolleyi]|uniref:Amino acid transporter n=1 Tax=Microdochium bolleyi TaxID=196109 RepID=A0A136IQU4_9PEZI|nr:amino acid transporter [Microdochium bolleyi]
MQEYYEPKTAHVAGSEESRGHSASPTRAAETMPVETKEPWWRSVTKPGSTWQIIIAAVLAIAIGMAVTSTVDKVPKAAIDMVGVWGDLWLRALKAVVLPLIITSMIIAMQRLKEVTGRGNTLGLWTVGWYVMTTILAVVISTILTGLIWARQFQPVRMEDQQATEAQLEEIESKEKRTITESIVELLRSFITDNFVKAMANMELLAVLVVAVLIGALLKPGSSILRAVHEIEEIVTKVITFLIYLAPIGVFFLILPNLFKLNIAEMGENLGYLIAGTLTNMFIHLFIALPILYFAFVRKNPYTHWLKCSPAWITAWGTASSAATMPVTMRVALERGCPRTVAKFAIPMGTLINMDGTAIYFPVVVTFLASTQGRQISPVDYIIVVLLSTVAAIGTTPIPSSSLVLTVMIAESIGLEITGMFAVVIAIDWFLDRFRTALNVSGDLFAVPIITKMTGIKDHDDGSSSEDETVTEGSRGAAGQTTVVGPASPGVAAGGQAPVAAGENPSWIPQSPAEQPRRMANDERV